MTKYRYEKFKGIKDCVDWCLADNPMLTDNGINVMPRLFSLETLIFNCEVWQKAIEIKEEEYRRFWKWDFLLYECWDVSTFLDDNFCATWGDTVYSVKNAKQKRKIESSLLVLDSEGNIVEDVE